MATVIDSNERANATIEVSPDDVDLDQATGQPQPAEPSDGGTAEDGRFNWRPIIAVGLSTTSAAVMAGGVFIGLSARVLDVIIGALGIGLATLVFRMRSLVGAYLLMVGGLFGLGLLAAMLQGGPDHLGSLHADVTKAVSSGRILRPPTDFTAGWAAISGWIMATVGFGAGWVALAVRKPGLGVMAPLPLCALAGISLPSSDQAPTAVVAVVLFGAALGVLAGSQLRGSDEKLPRGYELRRAARGAVFLAAITGVLVALSQTNLLFPHPLYDPTHHPEKPQTQPLSQVPDRVLFEVSNTHVSGPWVLGELDVYDGSDWYLPPFAENQLHNVPADGVVDASLKPGARATITIRGLTGAILPGLPNMVGIQFTGPTLGYDRRSGNIRLVEGAIDNGFTYKVASAVVDEGDLRGLGNNQKIPDSIRQFANVPPPPDAVRSLIAQAPKTSAWDEYDYLRNWVLHNVVATGTGTPVAIPPDRVQQIITSKQASPFEIVATQALLARWIGLPSRIGYGFDGGVKVNDRLEVHPKNGASFPEVYFSGYGWVPVVGVPLHAQASEGANPQQTNVNVLPSDDISVRLYIPEETPTSPPLTDALIPVVLIALLVAAVLATVYLAIPVIRKLLRRARRRTAAAAAGPRAEIALAYTEWRDLAADFGYEYTSDTPLMFAERFVQDDDHRQFAWLVTRALWGDLGNQLTPELVATAKELSGSLRRRLSLARPITVRMVALFSRRSIRHPYDVDSNSPGTEQRTAA